MNTNAKLSGLLAVCLFMASCAQIGPPIPPSLELPKAPTDLRASRKGKAVSLAWTEPTRTTDRRTVRYLGPTRICRTLNPELNACGTPVAVVSPPPKRSNQALSAANTQTYVDQLPEPLLEQKPIADFAYAIEVLNEDKRSAGLSNRVRVPAVPTLPPPELAAQLTGDGVVLSWASPGETSKLSDIQHHYRIYRRDEATAKDAVAGEVPVEQAGPLRFLDSSFEWERAYLYRITVVSIVNRSGAEEQVEGDDSPPVRVLAHDVFPPAVPSGVQAVYSGEGQKPFVDLIWAPVTNADLAGYNVYRREENGPAIKLNTELIKSPAYRDSAVDLSKTYWYSVSAVDVRANESARSDEASETVPGKD